MGGGVKNLQPKNETFQNLKIKALLLVAHWLEHWCASLVAQFRFLACPLQRQRLQGETRSCCCQPPHFRVLHAYGN